MEGECAISRRCGEDWVHAKAQRREAVARAVLAERMPEQVVRCFTDGIWWVLRLEYLGSPLDVVIR